MAKLPDLNQLGNAPSLRSGRAMMDADAMNLDAPAKGAARGAAGLQRMAKAVDDLGDMAHDYVKEQRKEQDSLDLIRADAEAKTRFLEMERGFDNDQDHATYDTRWQAGSQAIVEETAAKIRNPVLREKFQLQQSVHAESGRNRLLDRGSNLAKQETEVALQTSLDQHVNIYTDPNVDEGRRVQSRADIEAGITLAERTGVLTPAKAQQYRNKYLKESAFNRAQAELAADPEKLERNLADEKKWRAQSNSSTAAKGASADGVFSAPGLTITNGIDPAAPYMKRPRDEKSIKRIIMHGDVNENGDRLLQYGRKVDPVRGFDPGYHFYINRDGTVVQGAPLNRSANHTLNENADSIGIVIAGADAGKMPTAEQEAAAKRLVSSLGRTYNIDPKNVIGHGELQPGRRDVREGGNVAADIRKNGYLAEEDTSKLASRSLTRVAGLHPASDVPPATARPYADLTPEQLETMHYRASRAGGLKLESRRTEFKTNLENDIELVRKTGRGLPPERLQLESASKVLEGNQIATWQEKRKEAEFEYNIRFGIDQMPSDQIGEHLAHFAPAPDDPQYAAKARVLDKVTREINSPLKGVLGLRRRDPAAAVDGASKHPAVAKARAELDAELAEYDPMMGVAPAMDPSRRERLVASRLSAQEQLGIPDWQRQPITREEAKAIFADLPSRTQVGAKEYLEALKTKADEIEGTWGPKYARQIFRSAVKYALDHDKESNELQAAALEAIVKGEPVPPRLARGMVDLQEAETSGAAFGSAPLAFGIEGYDETAITPPAPVPAVRPEKPKGYPKPEPKDIEWLKKDPVKRQPQFDRDFGPKAAARALQ